MLHLLVDTSTWLDLARRRDGQRWIVALRVLTHQDSIQLLVPPVVLDEYDRNRERVEAAMTASVTQRFKLIRQDLLDYGGDDDTHAIAVIEDLSRHLPLVGAMTTKNFTEIRALLEAGRTLTTTEAEERRVIERGLAKSAPFHRGRNSVADAVLIELYGSATTNVDLAAHPHAFVTSNSEDFSQTNGDKREPHPDIASFFAEPGSRYALGVDGLDALLRDVFGEELEELFLDNDFQEDPRRLDEIVAADQEFFDRIWYHRSLQHDYQLEDAGDAEGLERNRRVAGPGRARVEAKYPDPGMLGPYTDFELGMLHGKMSAVRWVLGSEWDFLDT